MNKEPYTLDDVYFDLENAEIDLDRVYSLIKFAAASYENFEDITVLDCYSLFCSIEQKLDILAASLNEIKQNLQK